MMIRAFVPGDHPEALRLWQASSGVVLRDVDARGPITGYLARNPGMSFVAVAGEGGAIVGAVLAGTDGRRGYLQHLAVDPGYRRQGLGRGLVERCLGALAAASIDKCHMMVRADNGDATGFWTHLGWQERPDIRLMSRTISGTLSA